ncbi:hypothetical protein KC717_05260 [Candidatus Dojkabacteria bacterium]|uniref:Uncharacterized protein n=1 Tax=Candidatus Dojkabacteria bacterium TaxID=2099670 RepID=A0A955L9I9_9BACT|nr:hypothetical protein [Candidatus Dojkabacteria bacterium]
MEETVIKKRKGPMFWFVLTSIFWLIIMGVCAGITFAVLGSNRTIQELVIYELQTQLGLVEPGEEIEPIEEPTEKERELELLVEELQDELDEYKLREELEEEIRKEVGKESPTPEPTEDVEPTVTKEATLEPTKEPTTSPE